METVRQLSPEQIRDYLANFKAPVHNFLHGISLHMVNSRF